MTDSSKPISNHNLDDIVRRVRALKRLTAETGFKTGRSIGEILGGLNAQDLAEVSLRLESGDAHV
ncbi:MAG: hypothetical protein WCF26_12505 [Candidatus Sulfotelmatobacter sp.]